MLLPAKAGNPAGRAASIAVVAALAFLVAGEAASGHQGQAYYHVLTDEDWKAFSRVAAEVGPTYEVFVTHPWKAPILSAMTGKRPYCWLSPGTPPVRGAECNAVAATGGTHEFFILNDASLVVGNTTLPADLFTERAPGVWTMRADLAARLFEIQAIERPPQG